MQSESLLLSCFTWLISLCVPTSLPGLHLFSYEPLQSLAMAESTTDDDIPFEHGILFAGKKKERKHYFSSRIFRNNNVNPAHQISDYHSMQTPWSPSCKPLTLLPTV